MLVVTPLKVAIAAGPPLVPELAVNVASYAPVDDTIRYSIAEESICVFVPSVNPDPAVKVLAVTLSIAAPIRISLACVVVAVAPLVHAVTNEFAPDTV